MFDLYEVSKGLAKAEFVGNFDSENEALNHAWKQPESKEFIVFRVVRGKEPWKDDRPPRLQTKPRGNGGFSIT